MITIDTNVAARYLLEDIPDHHRRSVELFTSAASGHIELFVPAAVFTELSYVLTRLAGFSRQRAAEGLLQFAAFPRLHLEQEGAIINALSFWRDNGGVSFVDCYLMALSQANGITQIYTFDRKMNRYPGVERIEP
jgi:predicted nucleic acid-binding protein